ncbi:hypothetical protein [uncultured Clostridium sp.]|uniref:hypothetical protein n=1 Tax=uncultured Clostridium sp. TaxID=59620 RepID=UPI0025E8C502|nr:hypothetical protein [uncultured Clostridium sp.]
MAEWKTLIIYSVELTICGLILFYVAILSGVGRKASEIQQKGADAVEVLAEYREYNVYDNTILWSQDVISAILKYRGLPEVNVTYKNGGRTVQYTMNTSADNYTNEYLNKQFEVSSKFLSTLKRDEKGTH